MVPEVHCVLGVSSIHAWSGRDQESMPSELLNKHSWIHFLFLWLFSANQCFWYLTEVHTGGGPSRKFNIMRSGGRGFPGNSPYYLAFQLRFPVNFIITPQKNFSIYFYCNSQKCKVHKTCLTAVNLAIQLRMLCLSSLSNVTLVIPLWEREMISGLVFESMVQLWYCTASS